MTQSRGPNIRIPPAFFLAGFLAGLLLDATVQRIQLAGGPATQRALATTGWVIVWLALTIALSGVLTFRLAGTTMWPFRSASRLVQHGPYRFTRNPMYLGMTLAYVGFTLVMNTAWPLILLPLVLFGLGKGVIEVEERYLGEMFGEEYAAYMRRVRRWL